MIRKKFLFQDPIELPSVLSIHHVEDRFLIIAPEEGNWITVDEIGLDLVQQLGSGMSLGQAIEGVADRADLSFDETLDQTSYTLRAIESNRFYAHPRRTVSNTFTGLGLHLYATMQCNLRCIHCYADGGLPLPDELTTSEILGVLSACSQCGFERFALSGGEPLLHPDWTTILEQANGVGLSCALLTNGTLVRDLYTAQRIASLTEEVQVSLDGATEKVNDTIRGSGSYRKILRGLELLIEAGAQVFIAMTVLAHNMRDLEENIGSLADRLGKDAVAFRIAPMEKTGRAVNLPNLSGPELEHAGRRILQNLLGPELWAKCYSLPRRRAINCGYGPGMTVSADGYVYPCPSLYHPLGNVRQESFEILHQRVLEEHRRTAVDQMPLCNDCDLRYICAGGCRIYNHKRNGDMLCPVCTDAHKQAYYTRLSSS